MEKGKKINLKLRKTPGNVEKLFYISSFVCALASSCALK